MVRRPAFAVKELSCCSVRKPAWDLMSSALINVWFNCFMSVEQTERRLQLMTGSDQRYL